MFVFFFVIYLKCLFAGVKAWCLGSVIMGNILVSILRVHLYNSPEFILTFAWIACVIFAIFKLVVEKVVYSECL